MAKAKKKFETEASTTEAVGQSTLPVQSPPEVKGPPADMPPDDEAPAPVPARQSAYLQTNDGTQYQVVARPNLPKRAGKAPDGDLKIVVDGREYPAWVTSSKGWAAEDKVIDYIWVLIPQENAAPVSGFVTLDYLVPASTLANAEFTLGFGKANRQDPPRVAKDQAKEDSRKAQFADTMAKKKAMTPEEREAAETAITEADSETEGEGQEQ